MKTLSKHKQTDKTLIGTDSTMVVIRGEGVREVEEGVGGINGDRRRLDFGR